MPHLLYNFCLSIAWPVLWIYYRLRAQTDGKYRQSYAYRLGLSFPDIRPPSGRRARRVWIHALSVGETLSVAPLVRELKRERPGAEIVFSSATETGHRIARQRLGDWVSHYFFLPHDFPWAVRSLVKRIDPSLFVLVETDIWLNLLQSLKVRGVPVALVNGRVSQTSFLRYKRIAAWVQDVWACFDQVLAQSAEDRERYLSLGCPGDRVHTLGNLKFDAVPARPTPERIARMRQSSGIEEGRAVWVAGSTHEGEELMLLKVHEAVCRELPGALLVLAPRQVHRGADIARLCTRGAFSAVSRSSGLTAKGHDVYILDTLGELGDFYALGDAVFVGGSLVPFGGHNPLESVAQEKPTCWGPHLFNFREMERALMDAGCGRQVASEAELQSVILQWLKEPALRHSVTRAARRLMESHEGSSRRVARCLLDANAMACEQEAKR